MLFALDRLTFEAEFVPVNEGMAQFVSCYSTFLAAVFMAKSRAVTEMGLAYLTEAADWLEEQVRVLEPGPLSEGAFWSHLTYYLDDNGVPLRSPGSRHGARRGRADAMTSPIGPAGHRWRMPDEPDDLSGNELPGMVIERQQRDLLSTTFESGTGLILQVVTNRQRAMVMLLSSSDDGGGHAIDPGTPGTSDGFLLDNGQEDEYANSDTVPLQPSRDKDRGP